MKMKYYNDQFRVLPKFMPFNHYRYYVINESIDIDLLHDIVRLAQKSQLFTLNTQLNVCHWNRPICIAIEMIDTNLSTILLVQVNELPRNRSSLRFWLTRAIFKSIFEERKTIYVWGNIIYKLSPFLKYGLFTIETIETPRSVDIQKKFKYWHSTTYSYTPDEKNFVWDLQLAVAMTYYQQLDQSVLLSEWNEPSSELNDNKLDTSNATLIHFLCCRCLAITKLTDTILQS
ncbi:MAG: hypothetical protein ACRCV7_05015 [Culicoidibacterales bacterium]